MAKRTYLDPIHQDIVLDSGRPSEKLITDLIDTPEFQRLRRVHQLGVSYLTFQGSEHSRFTHSVGVMHIASRMFAQLHEQRLELDPHCLEYEKALVMATALLHDIGHGPYSHVTEHILGYDHEDWSCKIIAGDTTVTQVLNNFDSGLADKITSILKKTYKPHYVSDIVSSQLDCDRFDYLLRDSYMTGTAYGLFALNRILASLKIDEENDRIVVSGDKGQTSVEHYLFARYSMYASVYYHKKNLASKALLAKLMKRAKLLGSKISFIDEPTGKLILGEPLKASEYLQLDDVQMTYHIKRWMCDPDPILSDLAGRLINRRLFKAVRLTAESLAHADELEAQAKGIVAELGLDPEYYVATESTGIRPYDLYSPDAANPQSNIMVRTDDGQIKELSSLSRPVEALIKGNFRSKWLIFPAEAQEKIRKLQELAAVS
jgi:HD superfamily phosphohydrolase